MMTLFERFIPFIAERGTRFDRHVAERGTRFDRGEESPAQLESGSRFRYNGGVGSRFRYNGGVVSRFLSCVFVSALAFSPLQASDFDTGLEAYHESEYAAAAEAFERALVSEESAAAHQNLALSYFQLDQPAKAVWQLECAVRLDPLNESYLFKLGALRQQLGLYAAPAEWWQSAARLLSRATWIWIASISAWLLIAATVLPRISGKNRPIALKLLMGLSAVSILLAAAALSILMTQQASGVIVSEEAAALHHAPASAAPEAGLARPGERARLLDSHGNFLKIETEARITGWIQKDALGQL